MSQGFRAPSLKENSPSAATNSGGRGCTSLRPLGYISGTCYMAGNADLKPETSTAGEIGVAYENSGWDMGLTYFHTDFKNKIDYAPLGKFQGIWWTRMTNIQKARTSGLEATLTAPLTKNLSWRNNVTYMREAKNLTTGANLLSTPKLSWYSALGWQVNDQLFGEVSAQYTGKELDAGALANKAYTIVDAVVSYKATPPLDRARRRGKPAQERADGRRPGRLLRAGTAPVCRPDLALLS